MMLDYYMIRWTSIFYYSVEFLIALGVFFIVLYLYLKGIDKKAILVFITAGIFNTVVEVTIQTLGARVITDAFLLTIPINYPWVCFILGFYEGGVKFLVPYYFAKFFIDRDIYSKKMLILLTSIVAISFFTYSLITRIQLDLGESIITLTKRNMFSLPVILLLVMSFIITISYFFIQKKIPMENKKLVLYFYVGLIIYLLCFIIPLHVFQIRYIGVGESFSMASIAEQIFWMYGFFLFFEGPGSLMMLVVIIYHFKLIEFESITL